MSLSKYFKDSKSFKPEELVRQDNSLKPGWAPLPQKGKKPFQSENFANGGKNTSNERFKPSGSLTSQPNNSPVETDPPNTQSGQNLTPVEPSPITTQADLSQYIELSEAQLQIDQAYLSGVEEGKSKVDEDYHSAISALVTICGQLDAVRETLINNSSKELQDFAVAIVERLLRISVTEQDDTIVATIEEALQRAVRSDEFTIYLNPDDYSSVESRSEEIISGLTGLNHIVLKKDVTVERGGAKLESENCLIDATVASQFQIIKEEIKKRL